VNAAPTAQLLREAAAAFEATGADGRRYTLRGMNVLDRLRLFKALGAELANNEAYLGIAYLAFAVSAIDDVPVPTPASEQQLEALVGKLGDSGIAAIADAFAAQEAARPDTAPGN
jgi:hypothetical protein